MVKRSDIIPVRNIIIVGVLLLHRERGSAMPHLAHHAVEHLPQRGIKNAVLSLSFSSLTLVLVLSCLECLA